MATKSIEGQGVAGDVGSDLATASVAAPMLATPLNDSSRGLMRCDGMRRFNPQFSVQYEVGGLLGMALTMPSADSIGSN